MSSVAGSGTGLVQEEPSKLDAVREDSRIIHCSRKRSVSLDAAARHARVLCTDIADCSSWLDTLLHERDSLSGDFLLGGEPLAVEAEHPHQLAEAEDLFLA